MVPHWVRGKKEKCIVFSANTTKDLSVCALGGSVATPEKGLKAPVVEVNSFEDLEKLGENSIRGKIVFYNVSLDAGFINIGSTYGRTVRYRHEGASRAARFGAIASIVRSLTLAMDDLPHTGMMNYDTLVEKKIPCFAISTKSADGIAKLSFFFQVPASYFRTCFLIAL
jgi:carboxypeptidase Q